MRKAVFLSSLAIIFLFSMAGLFIFGLLGISLILPVAQSTDASAGQTGATTFEDDKIVEDPQPSILDTDIKNIGDGSQRAEQSNENTQISNKIPDEKNRPTPILDGSDEGREDTLNVEKTEGPDNPDPKDGQEDEHLSDTDWVSTQEYLDLGETSLLLTLEHVRIEHTDIEGIGEHSYLILGFECLNQGSSNIYLNNNFYVLYDDGRQESSVYPKGIEGYEQNTYSTRELEPDENKIIYAIFDLDGQLPKTAGFIFRDPVSGSLGKSEFDLSDLQ